MSEPMPPEEMARYWTGFINSHIPNFNKTPYEQIDNFTGTGAIAASSARKGRISRPPSEQLRPTESGFAWATETQKASIVWPESVRPLLSVMVTEICGGDGQHLRHFEHVGELQRGDELRIEDPALVGE